MLMLMAWANAPTLADRFALARPCVANATARRRRLGKTYQGFIKALLKHADTLLEQLQTHLRTTLNKIAGKHWTRMGWLVFAIDGSKIDLPRTAAHEQAFGTSGKNNSGPQLLLSVLWHLGTGLPWAWRIGSGRDSERQHLRDMLHHLPDGALLLADAGYPGFDLLNTLIAQRIHVLMRVGGNITLLKKLGYAVREHEHTVYLWPHGKRDQPPLTLRLIRVPGQEVVLITSVLDPRQLDDEQAAVMYKLRWGAEVGYRSLKQTLARRKMCSAAPRQAVAELHGSMLGLTLLGLMSVAGIIEDGRDPLNWSVALALRVVRQAMTHRPADRRRSLLRALAQAVKDDWQRKADKRARRWPHKKRDTPPGPPKVRAADARQVELAKQLRSRTAAA